jgi:hypothetical protein
MSKEHMGYLSPDMFHDALGGGYGGYYPYVPYWGVRGYYPYWRAGSALVWRLVAQLILMTMQGSHWLYSRGRRLSLRAVRFE